MKQNKWFIQGGTKVKKQWATGGTKSKKNNRIMK